MKFVQKINLEYFKIKKIFQIQKKPAQNIYFVRAFETVLYLVVMKMPLS